MSTDSTPYDSRTDRLKASPRMFDSRVLDSLSRVHWSVPLFVFVPAIGILLALAVAGGLGALAFVACLGGGYLVWTLTEYWLHRIVFHFEPDDGVGARLHWIIHGVHHDHPNDPKRLVMPPSVSVPLAALFFGLFVLALGTPAAYAFTASFAGGYLFYDMAHFYVHHRRPKGRIGKRLRELHMRHHFQDDTVAFGVSAPWWDHVFGTATPSKRRRGAGATR
jgi:sterol desaturase/sphingolipid hydroxylase (fatty acid hydroxylase superfamily)